MILETTRLKIFPLTLRQFALLLEGQSVLEEALGLAVSGHELEEHTQAAMAGLYAEALHNHGSYQWFTNWQIILKQDNMSAGSACFVGCPNENGEVEIGYGINEAHRGRGYMPEAVAAMCEWALGQEGVSAVIAGTEKGNIPSARVLEKCGLTFYKEDAECLWWRLEKGR